MAKRKKRQSQRRTVLLMVLGSLGLCFVLALLLSKTDIALLNPKGVIAEQQFSLMTVSVLLLLTIAVPTLILLYAFAWEYRESNDKAHYDPNARHSKYLVASMWIVPTIFMIMLAAIMLPATQKLDPKKVVASDAKPLTIQVIAMRWKWLFIYPEQNIATVNYVQIPEDTPVQFELTADEAPMSSFWIPHLGGQLYAMTGHVNRLNLMADEQGAYPGSTAEINGAGFAGMKFTARATSQAEFDKWVKEVQTSPGSLNDESYQQLLKPSENNLVATYAPVEEGLYAKMLMKYMGSHDHQPETYKAGH